MNRTLMVSVSCFLLTVSSSAQPRYSIGSSPDAWLIPVTIGVGAGGILVHTDTARLTMADLAALDRNTVPAFDRPATYLWSPEIRTASDLTVGVAVLAPMLVLTEFGGDYRDLMGMYIETLMLASSLPQYTKALGRVRPLAYNESAPFEERSGVDMKRSFFSGHTSLATAAGIFLATVYETYRPGTTTSILLWVAGGGLGLTAGTFRVLSGMHFPSDVAVGFIVGAAVGYAVPRLHRREGPEFRSVMSAAPPMLTFRIVL